MTENRKIKLEYLSQLAMKLMLARQSDYIRLFLRIMHLFQRHLLTSAADLYHLSDKHSGCGRLRVPGGYVSYSLDRLHASLQIVSFTSPFLPFTRGYDASVCFACWKLPTELH